MGLTRWEATHLRCSLPFGESLPRQGTADCTFDVAACCAVEQLRCVHDNDPEIHPR